MTAIDRNVPQREEREQTLSWRRDGDALAVAAELKRAQERHADPVALRNQPDHPTSSAANRVTNRRPVSIRARSTTPSATRAAQIQQCLQHGRTRTRDLAR